ncbi:hypothetical protein [Rhizobium sp.]
MNMLANIRWTQFSFAGATSRTAMKRAPIAAVLLLAACAKPPEEIAAAAVPTAPYMGKSCAELAALEAKAQRALADVEERQRVTAQEDRDSMWAVHMPVGTMRYGDREREVAVAKGELKAIAAARQSGGC